MLRILDLFSGIGGFSLGLARAGARPVGFVEIDPFCRRVLAKHWPDVPCHDDITTREFQEGEADVICGGFPCQDISLAGAGAGLAGERSGLYRELIRAIRVVRPRFAIVENVAALLVRGMGTVLGDLAAIGHDAEWDCIPASAVGAPHRRDRVWIVAHPERGGLQAGRPERARDDGTVCRRREHPGHVQEIADASGDLADAFGKRLPARRDDYPEHDGAIACASRPDPELADAPIDGRRSGRPGRPYPSGARQLESTLCDANGTRLEVREGIGRNTLQEFAATIGANWWGVEPDLGRVAHGVPDRVDRLRSLGNAVVPQIPEMIGRTIVEAISHD